MRKIIYCILFCSGIHVTQAQQGQWTPGVNTLYTDATVGLGTTSFTSRLHIADGFGGEQLRITRGTGSVRFAQDINKDNLYLFNNDATQTFMFWKENGNVGIGTASPSEKLTVAGNLLLNGGYPKITFGNRYMMQVPIALENSYTRGIVSQNIVWNESINKWSIPDQQYTDFSMMRFENGGVMGFYSNVNGPADMTNSEMEAYRRLTIYNNGNVGIGTNSPLYKLDVNGDSRYTGSLILEREGPNAMLRIKPLSGSAASRVVDFFDAPDINNSAYGVVGIANSTWGAPLPSVCFISSKNGSGAAKDIMMWANDAPSASNVALTIKANSGNIGIGTTNPGSYRLAVEGIIGARKVKVTNAAWADYVFHPTYRLRPLSEVEDYIQKHHRLPEVPSAAEVEKNGLDLGDNQATLLKKIEELTLYIIEQNKINKEQSQRLEQQQREIDALKKKIQ